MEVDEPIALLRRLLYCGEWIQSHALHVYLLHAPDFFSLADAVELAALDKGAVERGLRLKRAGNQLMETIGGRAIHPVNVRVGGFYRSPDRATIRSLAEQLTAALQDALDTVSWVAGFDFPQVEGDYRFVSLVHPDRYPIESGRIASSDGLDCSPAEFADLVVEEHVARSTALQARVGGSDSYLTGPLARYALNSEKLSPLAKGAAEAAGLGSACTNPFRSIVVRAVELVFACEEALRLIEVYEPPEPPSIAVKARRGTGTGATEAPRGLLLQRYEIDSDGSILSARHHAADFSKPAHDRGRPAPSRRGGHVPGRCRTDGALRAGHPQPRPVHLVCCAFPRCDDRALMKPRIVIAGLGNDYRRDDGAGLAVARLVARSTGVTDIGPIAEPLDLLGRWDGASLAVLVDATRTGATPGTVRLVDVESEAPTSTSSTHAIGLGRVVRLASVLGGGPSRVVVVGIEGADFSDGKGLTRAVGAAVRTAASQVAGLIAEAEPDR